MLLPQATMEALVSQYRGELSAIEAYEGALEKFAGQPEEATLLRLQGEHSRAAKRLREAIHGHGGVVPEGSGAWGAFASVIERLASLLNDEVPLQVLHRGEAVGSEGYKKLLAEPGLPGGLAAELRALLERSVSHQEALARLIHELPEVPNRPMT